MGCGRITITIALVSLYNVIVSISMWSTYDALIGIRYLKQITRAQDAGCRDLPTALHTVITLATFIRHMLGAHWAHYFPILFCLYVKFSIVKIDPKIRVIA